MGNEKQVKALKKRHGENYFSKLAGRPHARGNTFKDPEVRRKALETRQQNKLLKQIEEEQSEIPTDDNV